MEQMKYVLPYSTQNYKNMIRQHIQWKWISQLDVKFKIGNITIYLCELEGLALGYIPYCNKCSEDSKILPFKPIERS